MQSRNPDTRHTYYNARHFVNGAHVVGICPLVDVHFFCAFIFLFRSVGVEQFTLSYPENANN